MLFLTKRFELLDQAILKQSQNERRGNSKE